MIGTSTLSAIAFLATVSGLPGLNNIPAPATKEYSRAKAAAVAADTLPPPWRPSWRLALENSFVQSGLRPIGDPQGLALGNDGYLYVAESSLHRIIRIRVTN